MSADMNKQTKYNKGLSGMYLLPFCIWQFVCYKTKDWKYAPAIVNVWAKTPKPPDPSRYSLL